MASNARSLAIDEDIFSADFRSLGILKNIIVDYLPYCHIRPQLIEARKNKVTTT